MVENPALDIMLFIILLAVTTSLAFNLIIPIVKDSQELKYSEKYDKTVDKAQGYGSLEDATDGYMSIEEIVLQMMGQSYFMPKPRTINIAGADFEVTANRGFTPESKPIGHEAYTLVNNWAKQFIGQNFSNMRYDIESAYGYTILEQPSVKDMRFIIQLDLTEITSNDPEEIAKEPYRLFIKIRSQDRETDEILDILYRCDSGGKLGMN